MSPRRMSFGGKGAKNPLQDFWKWFGNGLGQRGRPRNCSMDRPLPTIYRDICRFARYKFMFREVFIRIIGIVIIKIEKKKVEPDWLGLSAMKMTDSNGKEETHRYIDQSSSGSNRIPLLLSYKPPTITTACRNKIFSSCSFHLITYD